MKDLAERGVKIIAPPLWVLVTLNDKNEIVPSEYAKAARAAGLDIITWSLERSGPLNAGGGFYYQSIKAATDHDGVVFNLLDVLAKQVGVAACSPTGRRPRHSMRAAGCDVSGSVMLRCRRSQSSKMGPSLYAARFASTSGDGFGVREVRRY